MQGVSNTITGIVIILSLIGLVMVASTTMIESERLVDNDALVRQATWVLAGVIAMVFLSFFDYHRVAKLSPALLGLTVVLLVAVLAPRIGTSANNARRWIRYRGFGLQPSELAKLAVVLFVAWHLAGREGRAKSFFRGFLPVLGVVGVLGGLIIVEPDFGTAVLVGVVGLAVAVLAGARLVHLAPFALIAVPFFYYMVWFSDYRRERLLAFLDPWKHCQDTGYQLCQSLVALGCGGTTGEGLGRSMQKLNYLPEARNDFIFAIIGEEMGFIGTVVIVMLFMLLVWYGIRVALKAKDLLGFLIASGVTLVVGLQAIINMAVVTGSAPTKGISLPFVSCGGSALVVLMGSMGILLNVARQAEGLPMGPVEVPAGVEPVSVRGEDLQ